MFALLFRLGNDFTSNINKNSIFEVKSFPSRNKSANIFKCHSMKQNINRDKLIKQHGKTEEFQNFYNLNFLVDETNRLLLYQPKMNSYNNDMDNILTERPYNNTYTNTNSIKCFSYSKENENKKYQEKINRKINKIIKAIK